MASAEGVKPTAGIGVLWTSWGISALLSIAYAALGAVTFNSLNKVYDKYPPSQDKRMMHGILASALGAPILVVLLDLVSLFILFYKTWKRKGTGFSYGFLDASFLHQGLFVFLSSFILLSDRDLIDDFRGTPLWTNVDSTVYTMTYILGFVVTGAFLILFVLLIVCQNAVQDHHRKLRRHYHPDDYEDSLLGSEPNSPAHAHRSARP